MKALVVYVSVHHGNTEKIARVLAKVLRAELLRLDEVDAETAITHDVVGFGSGIYFSRIHKSLLRFVSELPKVNTSQNETDLNADQIIRILLMTSSGG